MPAVSIRESRCKNIEYIAVEWTLLSWGDYVEWGSGGGVEGEGRGVEGDWRGVKGRGNGGEGEWSGGRDGRVECGKSGVGKSGREGEGE